MVGGLAEARAMIVLSIRRALRTLSEAVREVRVCWTALFEFSE